MILLVQVPIDWPLPDGDGGLDSIDDRDSIGSGYEQLQNNNKSEWRDGESEMIYRYIYKS
jgi:hypothetical protein